MLVPLEIAAGMVIVAISLVWSAMRSERSALGRAASVSIAIGALMVAIAGRFPPTPGEAGLSPLVTAGVVVVTASIFVHAVATVVRLIKKARPGDHPSRPVS
jgi:hypothetical protein